MPFGKMARELQGGKWDISDRLFNSVGESWGGVENGDNRELIPEFFGGAGEFLLNLNGFDFGSNYKEQKVSYFILFFS
jgi:Beige/BEACH domain